MIPENLQRMDVAGAPTVLQTTPIALEPYHPLGEGKNARLGREAFFQGPFSSEET